MSSIRRRILLSAFAAAVAAATAGRVAAQAYPTKPIRLVVPWPAGGGTDNAARALAEDLAVALGQRIIVDNRGGANGVIGAEVVARAAPDGYTIMFSDIFSHVLNKSLVSNLPYDVESDFAAVTQISTMPLLLVVHPSVPVKSVAELVQLAKEKPGALSYASFGTGSQAHIAGEMFKMIAGLDMVHVPYKGGAAALNDTLAGQVGINFSGISLARQHVVAGKLRALAVTSITRSNLMPEVPAVSETPGFEGFEAGVPFAVWVPARTPPEIIAKLQSTIARVISTASFKQKLERIGLSSDTIGNRPEEMTANVTRLIEQLPRVTQAAGLKAE